LHERFAHGIDESVPRGADWHRLLVDQLSVPIPGLRAALLPAELIGRIDELRRFRHAFRHMYFFDLDWLRLEPLIASTPSLLADFERTLDDLLTQLGA
jgi:hypothetical protein